MHDEPRNRALEGESEGKGTLLPPLLLLLLLLLLPVLVLLGMVLVLVEVRETAVVVEEVEEGSDVCC